MHLENRNFPWDGNSHDSRKTGNSRSSGIPESWEIPGREKFEATWEGGNRNFPLNIPARLVEKSSYGCKFAYSNGAWAVSGAVARVARDAPTSDPTPALQT